MAIDAAEGRIKLVAHVVGMEEVEYRLAALRYQFEMVQQAISELTVEMEVE